MLALVGAVMSRSSAGNVLLGDDDRVLGTHRGGQVEADPVDGVALGGVDATGEGSREPRCWETVQQGRGHGGR
jgi:hypothetical protein